jgi:small subunit ribosomal protein S4
MARYRGPRLKICRSLGVILPGLTSTSTLARPYPPGQHGAKRKSKVSDYRLRLVEKQKFRFHYGILEKQFKGYVSRASHMKGPAGQNLVRLLECRLDSVVWRLGLASSIAAARQLVVHGHIQINGKRVDRPSCQVGVGDQIAVCEKSRSKPFIQAALAMSASRVRPAFLDFDPAKAQGSMITLPDREDVPFEGNTQAIIEFYSQQL